MKSLVHEMPVPSDEDLIIRISVTAWCIREIPKIFENVRTSMQRRLRWFLTQNRKIREQKINLNVVLSLARHQKKLMQCWYVFMKIKHCHDVYVREVHREGVSDKHRRRRLVASVSDENIEKVRKLTTKDRRLTVSMITDKSQINHR
ncbi:hypothetical protein TNCV_1633781 [Trichonephila clavipes]|nr:hypothetical protein TNCV_1633781 [Trichonephila clavipes]